jgi:phage host-nuclease inhibitor protein Gam
MAQAGKGQATMVDDPVELDEHRGMAAQRLTEVRRRLHEVQSDQAELRRLQVEFEDHAAAAQSETWPEAAEKARYLIQLFAATPEARAPRLQALLAKVLDDLMRLSQSPE